MDGLETMLAEEGSGVIDEVLMDATEIISAIIIARGLTTNRVTPIFMKDGWKTTEKIKRIGRAEGMMRMREEMRKIKNQRLQRGFRDHRGEDFEEMDIKSETR